MQQRQRVDERVLGQILGGLPGRQRRAVEQAVTHACERRQDSDVDVSGCSGRGIGGARRTQCGEHCCEVNGTMRHTSSMRSGAAPVVASASPSGEARVSGRIPGGPCRHDADRSLVACTERCSSRLCYCDVYRRTSKAGAQNAVALTSLLHGVGRTLLTIGESPTFRSECAHFLDDFSTVPNRAIGSRCCCRSPHDRKRKRRSGTRERGRARGARVRRPRHARLGPGDARFSSAPRRAVPGFPGYYRRACCPSRPSPRQCQRRARISACARYCVSLGRTAHLTTPGTLERTECSVHRLR